ncbi:hypothetical protein ABW19_dt0206529 [Dactylella cylindrospora]|nr:hypothetical protein ABW19_dt0206529 [Dactylella cylindrospora]
MFQRENRFMTTCTELFCVGSCDYINRFIMVAVAIRHLWPWLPNRNFLNLGQLTIPNSFQTRYSAIRSPRSSKLFRMASSAKEFSTSGSQELHLTTVETTRNYIESISSSQAIPPVIDIIPLKGGTTNYTFRLTFDGPHEFLKDPLRRTAIFKYSANYVAATPDVPFDRQRQTIEAEAMTLIPSLLSQSFGEEISGAIKIPELFLHDPTDGVLIMEDVAPTILPEGQSEIPQGTDFRALTKLVRFADNSSPEVEYRILEEIATKAARYLFHLHCLDQKISTSAAGENILRSRFSDFEVSRKICVKTTFGDFMQCANRSGAEMDPSTKDEIQGILDSMSDLVLNSLDTFIMGDFWYALQIFRLLKVTTVDANNWRNTRPGNLIPAVVREEGKTPYLHSLALIDWEFATYGPPFLDLAHFAAEVWLAHNFIPSSSIGLKRLVAALFKSYREQGGTIDLKRVIYYIGGHITCFIDYAPLRGDAQEKKVATEKAIKLMLLAKNESWDELKEDEVINLLF